MAKAAKPTPTEHTYQVIQRPLVTEKSSVMAEEGWIAFEVAPDARKPAIKKAVETLYGVKVEQVNTLNQKGKLKRFRGVMGTRKGMKKALIKLAEGQTLDVSSGL